ncbi:MAG: C40 family peptidase [Planktomarina sp.]
MIDLRVELQDQYCSGSVAVMQVAVPVTDLNRSPDGPRDRQMIFGEGFEVHGQHESWAYGKTVNTRYVGFVAAASLRLDQSTNHYVRTQWATLYHAPDFKTADCLTIPRGALLHVTGENGKFWQTPDGFVPKQQVTDEHGSDPAAVALGFVGTPYLWGGNSSSGIDCSGLMQAAYLACGMTCQGDSDLMEAHLVGETPTKPVRNQLYFWNGHVAMTISETELVHANANAMAVTVEGIDDAIHRIEAGGDGPVTRRLKIPI